MPSLILASTSRYRQELLARLRLPFDAVAPQVDESPLPGEAPAAPVFIDGQKAMTLRGEGIAAEFQQIVENYIQKRFGSTA